MAAYRGGATLVEYFAQHIPPGARHGVGLGVGLAAGELDLLRLGAVASFDLYDVTGALLAAVEQTASQEGLAERVRCHVADTNTLRLAPASCDVVTCFASLHHVERLEAVVEMVREALRPGGVLLAHEYVGPDRFAFPAEHVELARAIYRTLDPALRCPWPELPVPNPTEVAAADPTEAVRSSEIVSVVRRYFPRTHVLSYDQCLTIILWYGLNYDALYDIPQGHDLVNWLLAVDRALVRSGQLSTYLVDIVAIKEG
ncbi:MAG TPA: class I SAM-dependent methyltransferase [Chloroflexota bacterium]|nr:class I SAM-dependent methyltransferase [Chloroflexota bacterium]